MSSSYGFSHGKVRDRLLFDWSTFWLGCGHGPHPGDDAQADVQSYNNRWVVVVVVRE